MPIVKMMPATVLLAALLTLAGCHRETPRAEDVRPVRAMRVAAADVDAVAEFPGEVRARIESRLGFRVPGKIVERKVDVGATVRRGQVLMRLDPQDLQLAASQAGAAVRAAETSLEFARADYERYRELRAKNFVAQAVLDAKNAAYRSAQANADAARAASRGQLNQAGYAALVADVDGVVTGIDAEAGQVVAAGTPVVRLARPGEKEIVIGVPEDRVDVLRKARSVAVRLWAAPDKLIPGRVREVSPVADPLTRTYAVKVAMPQAGDDVRLGMTATVQFRTSAGAAQLRVPLTALLQERGATAVWLVEAGKVRLAPVTVAGASGNDVLIGSGIAPGQTVVTAGVHQLKQGQKVTVLAQEPGGEAAK